MFWFVVIAGLNVLYLLQLYGRSQGLPLVVSREISDRRVANGRDVHLLKSLYTGPDSRRGCTISPSA